jgi:hypothetical protein
MYISILHHLNHSLYRFICFIHVDIFQNGDLALLYRIGVLRLLYRASLSFSSDSGDCESVIVRAIRDVSTRRA